MDTPVKQDAPGVLKRKPVQQRQAISPMPERELTTKVIPNSFLVGTIIAAFSLSWPLRWAISGAPVLVYTILLGESYGHRILPFIPVWTIFATVNLVYAVCSTSWLLYWVFWVFCWPAILVVCLFQFDAPASLARRTLRKTFLRQLHFINDQIAFFDLPALEIDTEVKGLFVIRGVTLSLSTMTLVAHGIEAGIKLSDDIELAIQTDKVVVPLFREITVDDVFANVKGGDWEVTFGDVAYGQPEPDDDPSVIVSNTAILRAASVAHKGGVEGRPTEMVKNMTAGELPKEAGDAKSAFASVKKLSPDETNAHAKYQELVRHIENTSAITNAKKSLREASEALKDAASDDEGNDKDGRLDLENMEDLRAAICAQIHGQPSIPHPPSKSIRVSTLRKTSHPNVKKFLHRLPFLYRLMLTPICYFHPVKFKSITAAGSGKWFVSLMRQYLFKHYSTSDAEIRRLESRISSWCADANFAVELGPIESGAEFPLSTNYNIKCHFKMSDLMAYRTLPDAVELQQVVRLGGADAILTIPTFLFPHHEHIFPEKPSDYDIMEMEQAIAEVEGTPKEVQARKELEKLKKDEASMHISAHAHLPAQFHQDLLNFIAAIVKATKVIESDKDFEEAKVLRELKRVSTNASDSDVSSLASVNTNNTDTTQTTLNGSEDKSFKSFLRKVDSGFKEASNKTMVGMRKAGHSTVHAMANDRWIARLVGKVTRKLERAQGEIGYSGEVPIPLGKYRVRLEEETKILP
ncbi:Nn.00g100280.m01.CDS01 [Neocucurbitaria sp. VM-36]